MEPVLAPETLEVIEELERDMREALESIELDWLGDFERSQRKNWEDLGLDY